ncbi:ABC transporter ATP-binding protein [candidate division TA06 bacterium]|uniref:ABC transporter ATP-binding protein n=1 Tax=candidate division TA06 bacterium TaxID=2250710 RepID=A0A933MJU3_UNCT6|nr:ABC transporter ATP-binding protein [candidate division TA06 bacterium]
MSRGIELKNLSKSFGAKLAVDDISLSIGSGEIFGLLGPNGAGKTTTLKMLAGILQPSGGARSICGFDLEQSPTQAKQCLGFIPDDPFIYEKLSGREFLRLVARLYGCPDKGLELRVEELIDRFETQEWIDRRAESYSHGMRQKTVLAATLLHQPKVYLIDEPLVGLDPASIILVKQIFQEEAKKGCSLLISTHTLSLAESVCHRIGIIANGRLAALGTLEELMELSQHRHQDLESLYLEFTRSNEQ